MKTKTIDKTIREKMDEWLASITDEKLRERVREQIMVAGGCIANMFLKEPVNDYDVYIMDQDVLVELALYYCNPHNIEVLDGRKKNELVDGFMIYKYGSTNEANEETFLMDNSIMAVIHRTLKADQAKIVLPEGGLSFEKKEDAEPEKYRLVYLSPNAISLSDDVQIVCRFSGEPEQILENYDYIHATNYWTFDAGLVLNTDALACLLSRELRYQGSKYPITSVIRSRKFIDRGYTINAGEYLKMCYQISLLDLNDPDVLEEQLIGVDIAYFNRIIQILREYKKEKGDFGNFLFAIIDKVFQ